MGGARTAMAKGAVMPLPKTATDSNRYEQERSFSIWPGATYLPLEVLNSSLRRPTRRRRPCSSISPRSPVRKKPSSVKTSRVRSGLR